MISISIISHNHGDMVINLVNQLLDFDEIHEIIITFNKYESHKKFPKSSKIKYIYNEKQKGFGANHNAAFKSASGKYFCVLNPDIEFINNPFPVLIQCHEVQNADLVGPLIISKNGQIEDSIRFFPSILSLFRKLILKDKGQYPLESNNDLISPDWIAGMFMLFESSNYYLIGGFDDNYYMYYEDVDICKRMRLIGKKIIVQKSVKVIHNAQRASHRNLFHMRWHLVSMFRYLWKYR